jgi:hypothetical protein
MDEKKSKRYLKQELDNILMCSLNEKNIIHLLICQVTERCRRNIEGRIYLPELGRNII